jgi:hypothetical protein
MKFNLAFHIFNETFSVSKIKRHVRNFEGYGEFWVAVEFVIYSTVLFFKEVLGLLLRLILRVSEVVFGLFLLTFMKVINWGERAAAFNKVSNVLTLVSLVYMNYRLEAINLFRPKAMNLLLTLPLSMVSFIPISMVISSVVRSLLSMIGATVFFIYRNSEVVKGLSIAASIISQLTHYRLLTLGLILPYVFIQIFQLRLDFSSLVKKEMRGFFLNQGEDLDSIVKINPGLISCDPKVPVRLIKAETVLFLSEGGRKMNEIFNFTRNNLPMGFEQKIVGLNSIEIFLRYNYQEGSLYAHCSDIFGDQTISVSNVNSEISQDVLSFLEIWAENEDTLVLDKNDPDNCHSFRAHEIILMICKSQNFSLSRNEEGRNYSPMGDLQRIFLWSNFLLERNIYEILESYSLSFMGTDETDSIVNIMLNRFNIHKKPNGFLNKQFKRFLYEIDLIVSEVMGVEKYIKNVDRKFNGLSPSAERALLQVKKVKLAGRQSYMDFKPRPFSGGKKRKLDKEVGKETIIESDNSFSKIREEVLCVKDNLDDIEGVKKIFKKVIRENLNLPLITGESFKVNYRDIVKGVIETRSHKVISAKEEIRMLEEKINFVKPKKLERAMKVISMRKEELKAIEKENENNLNKSIRNKLKMELSLKKEMGIKERNAGKIMNAVKCFNILKERIIKRSDNSLIFWDYSKKGSKRRKPVGARDKPLFEVQKYVRGEHKAKPIEEIYEELCAGNYYHCLKESSIETFAHRVSEIKVAVDKLNVPERKGKKDKKGKAERRGNGDVDKPVDVGDNKIDNKEDLMRSVGIFLKGECINRIKKKGLNRCSKNMWDLMVRGEEVSGETKLIDRAIRRKTFMFLNSKIGEFKVKDIDIGLSIILDDLYNKLPKNIFWRENFYFLKK